MGIHGHWCEGHVTEYRGTEWDGLIIGVDWDGSTVYYKPIPM